MCFIIEKRTTFLILQWEPSPKNSGINGVSAGQEHDTLLQPVKLQKYSASCASHLVANKQPFPKVLYLVS